MMSGKTSELVRQLVRAQIAGKRVILLRPNTDNREFLTHSKLTHDIEEKFISSINEFDPKEYDVIGVDEFQFFPEDSAYKIDTIVNMDKIIIVSALNGTSERTTFQTVQNIIPLVDDIIFEAAVCTECGDDHAPFTHYKLGEKNEDVKVGGQHEYTALCRKCYIKKNSKSTSTKQ